MKDLETRMKELAFYADNLLSEPNIITNRSIFVEGVIHLDYLINHIILHYFLGYLKEGKLHLTDHAEDFEKNIIYNPAFDFTYNNKIELLKSCGVINNKDKYNELKEIGSDRNKASHRMSIHFGKDVAGWFKGSRKGMYQKKLKSIEEVTITDKDVEEYKKKFADCYAYLFFKDLYLRTDKEDLDPDREDSKIENPKTKN